MGYQNGKAGKKLMVSGALEAPCHREFCIDVLLKCAEPDAGIVNFYQEKDTLMAHVDRSEVCATSPLVSIS